MVKCWGEVFCLWLFGADHVDKFGFNSCQFVKISGQNGLCWPLDWGLGGEEVKVINDWILSDNLPCPKFSLPPASFTFRLGRLAFYS